MDVIRVAASADAVITRKDTKIVGAYIVGGSANSVAKIFDEVTQSGTERLGLSSLANHQSPCVHLEQGILFRKGVSVTLTGIGAVLYLLIE